MKIEEDKKPICSCGAKMILCEYNGYYESFKYWECENCDLNPEDYDSEYVWSGSYA